MINGVLPEVELENIEKQVEEEIASAVAYANSGEEVGSEDYLNYVYETPLKSEGNR